LKRPPSEYIRSQVWLTTQPMEEPAIKSQALDAIDWIGWDRLLFATDYPHWDYDDPEQCCPPVSISDGGGISSSTTPRLCTASDVSGHPHVYAASVGLYD
jgi:hypothetical protein